MPITEMLTTLSSLGFAHVLLWLLTFAIVNGLMAQAKMLDNARETRAIIAIVAGFFVVLATPVELISVISNMSAGMILVVMALLVIFIFVEALGVKTTMKVTSKDPKTGQPVEGHQEVAYFTKHGYIVAAVLIIVAVLIFFASGGGQFLGLQGISVTGEGMSSAVLIIVVIFAIIWLIAGEQAN